MANGKRLDILRGSEATRTEVLRTDYELQSGPGPERIDRMLFANDQGITGDGTSTFPATRDWVRIGHVPIIRGTGRVTHRANKMVSDSTPIPAVYAGNPLP